ncbi:MAG TPA: DUF971 domain-containing protein [Fibrobacteria bacterium]|nr:DUF971 domain-containing protein [Fibrobacteria bacterium]
MIRVIAPTAVWKQEPDTLAVRWNDGTESRYPIRALRCSCPCAVCVNEWTGEKMLDESKVPQTVKPQRVFSVGRYAVGIHWSDGHNTGIYSYDYLKKLDPGKAP